MLSKPYKFVTQVDHNKYYFIETQEHPYIAIESVLEVLNGKKTVELQQGLKLIPVNAPMSMLLNNVRYLGILERSKVETIYQQFNVEELRKSLRSVRDLLIDNNIDDELPYDVYDKYEQVATNNTILSLEHQGFDRLYSVGAIGLPVHGRTTWLYKVNSIGGVTLMEVTTVGKDDPYNNVVSINTHLLSIPLIDKVMRKIEHKDMHKMKQENKQTQPQEDKGEQPA